MAAVLLTSLGVGSPTRADAAETALIAFQAADWKSLDVAVGAGQGFEARTFDDSSWSTSQAGFGTTDGTCSWNNADRVHTAWTPNTDMLLRHHFAVPAGVSSLHLSGDVDNGASVFVNGVQVGSANAGNCGQGAINIDIPAAGLTADNVLAIRASDDGSATFIDVQLTTAAGKPSLPALDAGTFANFRYGSPPGAGQACTTGFGVSKGGVGYETGAKHCITDEADTHDNTTIASHQPMTINTNDDKFTFASGINCSPPSPSACLLPTVVKGQTGDVMAWKPDTATVTGRVQTAHGVLPVLGAKTWQSVQNQAICHYGGGSAGTGAAERCGTAFSQASAKLYEYHAAAGGTVPFDSGLVPEPMSGSGGDSGGPVYVYNADKTGVYAIGIEIGAGHDCLHVGRRTFSCLDMSFIMPIGTVLNRLGGAALVTSAT